jgi:S-adenosylmethionine-diacylglycerol 3-amino-3-carboxypropyl transferase
MNRSEIAQLVDFSPIRYGQCWEDADILLAALDIQPGHTCVSIASAGDNVLAMVSKRPRRVIAVDLSPAQIACLELRVAAYRTLSHCELLELVGSLPSQRRLWLYQRCRPQLAPAARAFWDARATLLSAGIGSAGKFERYLALFRSKILPLIHPHSRVAQLLQGGPADQRERFYQQQWNTWRWRLMYKLFFSRFILGRYGRDSSFFRYVEGSVAERLLQRTNYALTKLNPVENPYLQWILTGRHVTALPYALRPEHFEAIRDNLDCLELHCTSIEQVLDTLPAASIDRYNLSDVFEYMSTADYHQLLSRLVEAGTPGARLAYWNMLVPRSRPAAMAAQLKPLVPLAQRLFEADKAFFYSTFVVEEVRL